MNNKDELLKHLLQQMLERLMEGERTALLGYNKHEYKGYGEKGAGNGNSRNGYYERDLLTGLGLLDDLKIPGIDSENQGFKGGLYKSMAYNAILCAAPKFFIK